MFCGGVVLIELVDGGLIAVVDVLFVAAVVVVVVVADTLLLLLTMTF